MNAEKAAYLICGIISTTRVGGIQENMLSHAQEMLSSIKYQLKDI